jgi:hypothetical protein
VQNTITDYFGIILTAGILISIAYHMMYSSFPAPAFSNYQYSISFGHEKPKQLPTICPNLMAVNRVSDSYCIWYHGHIGNRHKACNLRHVLCAGDRERSFIMLKQKYCFMDNAFATISASADDSVYLVLDNGEEAVCHDFCWLPHGARVLVTLLSVGREQGKFRRISIDSVDYDTIYTVSEHDLSQCSAETVA